MYTVKLTTLAVICVAVFGGAYVLDISDGSDAAATITFDPNDGIVYDGNNNETSVYSISIDSPVYVPGANFRIGSGSSFQTYNYVLEGYGFLGWSDTAQNPDAENYEPHVDYQEGGLIPSSGSDKIVYAVWEKKSYPVNLKYTDDYSRTIYIPYGRELQDLSSYMNYVPEGMEGYRVVGWSDQAMSGMKDANGAYLMGGAVTAIGSQLNSGYYLRFAMYNYHILVDANTAGYLYLPGNDEAHALLQEFYAAICSMAAKPAKDLSAEKVARAFLSGHSGDEWALSNEANADSATLVLTYTVNGNETTVDVNIRKADLADYETLDSTIKAMDGTTSVSPAKYSAIDFENNDKRYSQIARLNMGAGDMTIYAIWGKVYTLSNTTITTISDGEGCYYITANQVLNGGGMVINSGTPHLFISSIDLIFSEIVQNTNEIYAYKSPFVLSNGADVELTVMTDCTFHGGTNDLTPKDNPSYHTKGYAGINVPSGTTLTISEYSEGTLYANGGDAYERNSRNRYYAYPGAGIGTNGNEQPCGTIIIDGGKVNAVGGSCIEQYSSNGRNKTSAPGIGGSGATVTINDGIVVATSGNVHAQTNFDCSTTRTVNGKITEVDAIMGSTISISPNADVRENKSGESHTYSEGAKELEITFSGSLIRNAMGVTINGTSLNLGGMTVTSGTVIEIPAELVPANQNETFPVILSTGHNNFLSGDASWDYGNRYTVWIEENNDLPRALVYTYLNEETVQGTEVFASIDPHEELTICGNENDEFVLQPFTLVVAQGYEFTGVKTSSDGITWSPRIWLTENGWEGLIQTGNNDENIIPGPGEITIYLRMNIDDTGKCKNYVSFTIEPVSYSITYTVRNNENANFNFQHKMISTDDQNPEDIQWGNSAPYNTANQRAYYKSGKTLVFHTEYGNENPFNILLVTINGQNVTSNLTNQGDGTFTLEISDINRDLAIEVHYRPTMLIKAYKPVLDNAELSRIGTNARVTLVDANGDPIPLVPGPAGVAIPRNGNNIRLPVQGEGSDSTGDYVYAYVNRNDSVYFIISDYTILRDDSTPTDIKDIRISIGNTSYIMPSGLYVDEIYEVPNAYANTSILVTLSQVQVMVTCISYNGADSASSTIIMSTDIETFNGAYITLPTAESLAGMTGTYCTYDSTTGTYITTENTGKMYVKTGYKLLKWKADSGYELAPGSQFNVYKHETFTAQWDTQPEEYTITYDLKGYISVFNPNAGETGKYEWKNNLNPGTNGAGNPSTYNINTGTITINPGTLTGYDCLWSLDGAAAENSITITPGINDGDFHRSITLTAYWTPKNVTIRYHNNLPIGATEQINLPGTKDTVRISNETYYVMETEDRTLYYMKIDGGDPKYYDPSTMAEVTVSAPIYYVYADHNTSVGKPYGSLPYYRNFNYNGKDYSFGGWATNSLGSEKITEKTIISMPNNPQNIIDLYIIWIEGSTYVISLEYDRNQGSATISALSGLAGDSITLIVNPSDGYKSYKVSYCNNLNNNYVELDTFHQGNSSATIQLSGDALLFRIKVEFIPIEYWIKVLRPYNTNAETEEHGGNTYYIMETESGTQYYMRIVGDEPTYYNSSWTEVTVSEDTYYIRMVKVLNSVSQGAVTVEKSGNTYYVMETDDGTQYYMRLINDVPTYYNPDTLAVVTVSVTTYYTHDTYNVTYDPIYITKPQSNAYQNHTFYGWSGTDIVDVERNVIEIPKGSYEHRRYIEIWTPNAYSITYHLFGGTHSNPTRCNVGEVMILSDAVKAGYGFDGWYQKYDENNLKYSEPLTNNTLPDNITGDIDLYAKYIEATEVDFPFDSYDDVDEDNKKLIVNVDAKTYTGYLQKVIEIATINTSQGLRPAYSFSGSFEGTYANNEMVFTVTLEERCVWGNIGGSHINPYLRDYEIEVRWSIAPRTLYIITPSYAKAYDGTAVSFLADCYKTIGLSYADYGINSRFLITFDTDAHTFTNAGEYPLTVEVDDTKYAYSSYSIIYIQGSCVIFDEDCSTFTVPIKQSAPQQTGAQMSAHAVAHMLTFTQTVPGQSRRLIG